MRSLAGAAILAALVACGGGGGARTPAIPDQAGVDACFLTIGVAKPGETKLGVPEGWIKAAQKANESANLRIKLAGAAVRAALDPIVVGDGYSDGEIETYRIAVVNFEKACKDTNAFKGSPFVQPT